MYIFLVVIHLLICLALIGVVLVQSGKGGGLAGGAFGGSAQTVLGGRGATDFITRATMVLGAAFFITSLTLAIMTSGGSGPPRSVLQTEAQRQAQTQPQQAAPVAPRSATPAPSSGAPSGGTAPAPSGGR
jgi:preprotein translocase subunit SecG